MSYNYYRKRGGWGTNQYQFPAPLAPSFQPQPSWGGMDYFRAHAESPDLSLYHHAWDRVRNYSNVGDMGVGLNEARHWHRRAYGGLGKASQMLPEELGHAAAYEAYRTWMHNSSIYEPLSGDMERQREGLIGLAIAEATRLLAFTGLSRDRYSRQNASAAAAATASVIFAQSRSMDIDPDYNRRSRSNSFSGAYGSRGRSPYGDSSPYSGGSPYGSSSFDPYAYDNTIMYPSHHRSSHHRSSSHSRSRRHSSSSHHAPPIVVAGNGQYGYGSAPVAIPGSTPQYGSYGSYGNYGGQTMAYPVPSGSSMPAYGGGYATTLPAAPTTVIIPSRKRRHSTSSARPRSANGYYSSGYSGSYRY